MISVLEYQIVEFYKKMLDRCGVTGDKFLKACTHIDKKAKVSKLAMADCMRADVGLTYDEFEIIYAATELTNVTDLGKYLGEDDDTTSELSEIFRLAKETGIGDWLQFDASIVRGLSYYTGVVFEGFFKNSAIKRSVCGGGRYDDILLTYGYKERVPAVGFGLGDVVIIECLKELGKLPEFKLKTDVVIIPFNDMFYVEAVNIANVLRKDNRSVSVWMDGGKLRHAYSYADRINADKIVLLAPDEWGAGKVVVKYLRETDSTKNQVTVDVDDIGNYV